MRILDRSLEELKKAALRASDNAYCPYSKFRVGAVVRDENDRDFTGCNVENAAYGLTICAERNAIFQAIAQGSKSIKLVVVYTPTPHPTAPCGSCRQVINEFGPDAEIYSLCDGPEVLHKPLSALLPDAFGPKNIKYRRHS